jgi:hypothetical protein
LAWKEARVSLVRRAEAVSPVYAATLGGPEEAGRQLGQLAGLSGLKPESRVHGLGDGAPWIAKQMEVQFGAQGSYLIDFYHLCDYLSAAAPRCSPQTHPGLAGRTKDSFQDRTTNRRADRTQKLFMIWAMEIFRPISGISSWRTDSLRRSGLLARHGAVENASSLD